MDSSVYSIVGIVVGVVIIVGWTVFKVMRCCDPEPEPDANQFYLRGFTSRDRPEHQSK